MDSRNQKIATSDGTFDSYVSYPSEPNGHAVIVLQEIFGVNQDVRAIADRFAQDGFLAYAPDLYWRQERNVQLTHSKDDLKRAFVLLQGYVDEEGLHDIEATAEHIRRVSEFTGKVAAAGMCLGGKLAYLAATSDQIDAAVALYGVGMEKRLDVVSQIQCPLLMMFGELDKYVPKESREAILEATRISGFVQHRVFAHADHGFYTRGDAALIYDARKELNSFLTTNFGMISSA